MADRPGKPDDLSTLFSNRATHFAASHKDKDTLVQLWHGELPSEFDDFFAPGMHIHLINMTRLAWDDLANLTGKVFPIKVPAKSDSSPQQKAAETVEEVNHAYNGAGLVRGGMGMDLLMKVLSWWLVGTADAVAMVLPDYELQTPFFHFRDPRSHYPPVGWTPYSQAPLDNTLFAYQMTYADLKLRFPEKAGSLDAKRVKYPGLGTAKTPDDNAWIWVGEYYDTDAWYVSTLEDRTVELVRSEAGDRGHPGVQPAVPFSLYSPNDPKGRSSFADQASIQAAMSRMFSQKLDFFDRTLYPMIFTTKLSHQNIRVGPYAINEWESEAGAPNPNIHVVGPTNAVDADQMMNLAMGLQRMLNRNPESFQGAGPANSAKALEELRSGVTGTVRDGYWPAFINGLPKLYAAAMRMDMNLWGEVRKSGSGRRRNAYFSVTYRPRVALRGYEDAVRLQAGIGLAGYQGTLEVMQLYGAGMLSLEDALEQMVDYIDEPVEAQRKLQAQDLQRLMFASLGAKAQGGQLRDGALADLLVAVERDGKDLYDEISRMEQEGLLMIPPAPPPGMPGMGGPGGPAPGPGGGGLPPELMAALGGKLQQGAVPGGSAVPSLEALRG